MSTAPHSPPANPEIPPQGPSQPPDESQPPPQELPPHSPAEHPVDFPSEGVPGPPPEVPPEPAPAGTPSMRVMPRAGWVRPGLVLMLASGIAGVCAQPPAEPAPPAVAVPAAAPAAAAVVTAPSPQPPPAYARAFADLRTAFWSVRIPGSTAQPSEREKRVLDAIDIALADLKAGGVADGRAFKDYESADLPGDLPQRFQRGHELLAEAREDIAKREVNVDERDTATRAAGHIEEAMRDLDDVIEAWQRRHH